MSRESYRFVVLVVVAKITVTLTNLVEQIDKKYFYMIDDPLEQGLRLHIENDSVGAQQNTTNTKPIFFSIRLFSLVFVQTTNSSTEFSKTEWEKKRKITGYGWTLADL